MTIISSVEHFFNKNDHPLFPTNIPYITTENSPELGLLTALRFLEWTAENPNGVISLPTGKTSEHFIVWLKKILAEWDTEGGAKFRQNHGLQVVKKPVFSGLHFVQAEEFYPINPIQHNSYYNYVQKYYVEGFGLDASKGLFINCNEIPLAKGKSYQDIFPKHKVDLSLRYREAKTEIEKLQQQSIYLIDEWCCRYEQKIRELGGIGFYLGGIGPDGHIASNVRGSDFFSTTRLTETNFETQAVTASDLGGIEVSRFRPVITIGLSTLCFNQDAVVIIYAAGEAKAEVIQQALEEKPSNKYPATVLSNMANARFYLTKGATSLLQNSVYQYYINTAWNQEKSDRAIIDLCKKIDKFSDKLKFEDLQNDSYCKHIPNLCLQSIQDSIDSIVKKIDKGMAPVHDKVIYNTAPHHDDILLGMLPYLSHIANDNSNQLYFSIMTSGFNAVTNTFLIQHLSNTLKLLRQGDIQMVYYANFFTEGYKMKRVKDVYHSLIKIASRQYKEFLRGFAHRMVRNMVEIWQLKSVEELDNKIEELIAFTRSCYDGQKMPVEIQRLKGMIREFEEELVWGHFGMMEDHVHHLRLGFYKGDMFTEKPDLQRDVLPILQELRTIKPDIISLAFDPEGSGPDTHYKVLQTLAEAIKEWGKEQDISQLKIWGYRNVWYQFHPAEATHIVPVSLNDINAFNEAFSNCYLSQVEASFPSYKLDGKFSNLAQNIWVEQLQSVQLLLGKPYFFQNSNPKLRATHGLMFLKEMSGEEFLTEAHSLAKSVQGA
ncbi:MAG: 6-phosphogluconolactonase [Bacteroidales bacterium]|nr:6-phosphogluconolactonase [Bacteroidales bacterium]